MQDEKKIKNSVYNIILYLPFKMCEIVTFCFRRQQ